MTITGSQGNASLIVALKKKFPQIKVCAYEHKLNSEGFIPQEESKRLKKLYPLKTTPAIVFYDKLEKKINEVVKGFTANGGIETFDFLKKKINDYQKAIPYYIL